MTKFFNYLKSMYDKYKCAFYSAMFFTFLTHVYFFIKRFANEDDLGYILFAKSTLTSGRWTTGSLFTGAMLAPMIKFVFALLVIALISVLICDLFGLKKKSSMIMTSLILSTFPSLAVSFGYLLMAEIYLCALLSAVLAVYIAVKLKYGFIFSSFLIAYSLGNYQSYIGVASALSILYLIKMLLDKKDTKEIITMFLKLLFMGVVGVGLYFVILNIYLKCYNVSLSNYKGANSMGLPPVAEWPRLFGRTYFHFVGYFIGYTFFKSPVVFIIFRMVLVLISLLLFIIIIKDKKIYEKKLDFILLIVFVSFLPLAVNIVDFMAYKTDLSVLNIYQFSLTYLLCVYVIEKYYSLSNKNIKNYVYLITIICFGVIGWQNFRITNSYYYKIEKFNQYTENFNNRLLSRIEATEGYDYDMPVMFVAGEKNSAFYNQLVDTSDWSDIVKYDQGLWWQFIGCKDIYDFNYDAKIFLYIDSQLGIQLTRANDEQRSLVYNSKEFEQLKEWPSIESIKIINGILVVKI